MLKWATRLLILGVVTSMFFWATVIGAMVSDRVTPVTVLSSDVLTPQVAQGGLLRVHYSVYRLKSCRALIERVIIDGQGNRVVLADVDFESAGPVGADSYVSPTVVPVAAFPGRAKYRVTISYSCNVIHRVFWPIVDQRPDLEFEITPAKVKESRLDTGTPLSVVPVSINDAAVEDFRFGPGRNLRAARR